MHAVSELACQAHGELEREPGLADATGAGNGDKPAVAYEPGQLGKLLIPADDWSSDCAGSRPGSPLLRS